MGQHGKTRPWNKSAKLVDGVLDPLWARTPTCRLACGEGFHLSRLSWWRQPGGRCWGARLRRTLQQKSWPSWVGHSEPLDCPSRWPVSSRRLVTHGQFAVQGSRTGQEVV